MRMAALLSVFFGGALGAVCRLCVCQASQHVFGGDFPWGVLCANMAGSFFMGLLMGRISCLKGDFTAMTSFFATGILGGFTTFSSYALDTVILWHTSHAIFSMVNAALNVMVCMALAAWGWRLGAMRKLF